jgi:hypothetical protein
MHPTRNSAAFTLNRSGGRVMPGVRRFPFSGAGIRIIIAMISVGRRSVMLRLILNLTIALLTFSVGVGVNSFRHTLNAPAIEKSSAPETSAVTLCELKATPRSYRNMLIRMRATLVDYGWGQSAYFYDESCRDTNDYVETLPVTPTNREKVKPTIDTLVAINPSPRRVEVVVTGYLDCWVVGDGCIPSNFTIEHVEQAIAVAPQSAWPWEHPTCSQ